MLNLYRLLQGLCPLLVLFIPVRLATAQGVAINADGSAANSSAMLDIKSTTKGLLIPSMTQAQRGNIPSPAYGLLIYQTDNTPGFYYNSGAPSLPVWTFLNPAQANTAVTLSAAGAVSVTNAAGTVTSVGRTWLAGGNNFGTGGGSYSLGTVSNDNLDLLTGNTVRGRLSTTGQLFVGGVSAPVSGSVLNVSSSANERAVSGYSTNNGAGIYGLLHGASTTTFGAVYGENIAIGAPNSSGVRALNGTSTAGNAWHATGSVGPRTGLFAAANGTYAYSTGVYGYSPGLARRNAGVVGDEGGFALGALGMYSSSGNDYGVYGFGSGYETGTTGGRSVPGGTARANAHIGLGISGGVMGGWVRGQVYGLHARGERYSLYVDGAAVMNQPLTQLVTAADGQRVATYAASATTADVSARGRAELREGQAFIPFPAGFAQLLLNPQEATITVTPAGETRGVFVERVVETGFYVRENQQGHSRALLNWTATGTRRDVTDLAPMSAEVLDAQFDPRMRDLMHNEADTAAPRQAIWWDGQQVRYDQPPAHPRPTEPVAPSPTVSGAPDQP
ncbi:hypothetical protein LJY25_10635 [Hymenobacter sp. BT175]|uniref:hypothetical protein n=1 Tax=Hymenobacter translucens TaxID=2886507 RepID=UPI001D0DEB2E|nr:hypothetical protein [Hymenobacter translucens]MCC2546901.1 hypothetical protein [Hymenobacter translucens]